VIALAETASGVANTSGSRSGQQGGRKQKTLRAKVLGGSQKISGKLEKLFSSFLRGASCPKSPRVAATAAPFFMLDNKADVKHERR
jgi:hypothetical protein